MVIPNLRWLYTNFAMYLQHPPFRDEPVVMAVEDAVYGSCAYLTEEPGDAIWIIGGVHGDEPSGPLAIAELGREIASLGCPTIVLPLVAPAAYAAKTRFGQYTVSLSDCSHLMTPFMNPARADQRTFANTLIELKRIFRPRVVIDLHEDDRVSRQYCYVSGKTGLAIDIATAAMSSVDRPLLEEGETRFGELCLGGIVTSDEDGSIDEFLTEPYTVSIVYECPALEASLQQRVMWQKAFLRSALSATSVLAPPVESKMINAGFDTKNTSPGTIQ